MISRTLLITSIAGLCLVLAGKAIKPAAHTGQDSVIFHTGQDPVKSHTGQDPVHSLGTGFTSIQLVTGLARPVQVVAPPNDFDRIFIVEQRSGSTGRIRIFNLDTNSLNSTHFYL